MPLGGQKCQEGVDLMKKYLIKVSQQPQKPLRDHPFKTSACLRGEGCQKFTVHKDQKSPS